MNRFLNRCGLDAKFIRRYASDTANLTWGGQTYETSDGRVSGPLFVDVLPISSGVDLQETEAILVTFL
jgi:hypothetical protein